MKKKLSFLISALMFIPFSVQAKNYTLDVDHTEVGFSIKHLKLSTVRGKFKQFEGGFSFDEKGKKLEALKVKIQADSIDTNQSKRDEHLRGEDFFDTKKFPTLEFVAKKVDFKKGKPQKIHGDLTMHGVTRPAVLKVDYKGTVQDPWGNEKLVFSASTKLDRKDFGLTWSKVMETGGLVVGNEVEIIIDGEATAQK